ncbi:MAG: response regulator [Desulforhopalus sp.]
MTSALMDRCELACISNGDEFQKEISARQYDLVFLDADFEGEQAMTLLDRMHQKDPFLPIIMTSQVEKAEVIVEAVNKGASDFLVHPISPARINITLDKALEIRDQRFEIAYHRRQQDVVYDFKDVIAFSPSMKKILKS